MDGVYNNINWKSTNPLIFRSGLKYRPKYTTKSTEKMFISRLKIGTLSVTTVIALAESTTTMIIGTAML